MSNSENLKAVIQSISEEKNVTKNFLEIWDEEKSLMNFDLNSLDLHRLVYSDGNHINSYANYVSRLESFS